MKKIIHLTSVHPVQDVRIFFKECLSLKEAGFKVGIIAQSAKDAMIEGIEIHAIKKTSSRFKRMTWLLWQIYQKALQVNADLYHFHDPELIPVGLLLRLSGKKVIYDVHEDVPRDIMLKAWIPRPMRRIIAKFIAIIEYYSAKLFNAIITVTPHISHRFAHVEATEIRNYPKVKEFPSNHLEADRNSLCYSGLITLQRGFNEMIQLAQSTQTRLLLAGHFGHHSFDEQVRQCDFIEYLGYLNRHDLNTLYGRALAGLALLHPGPTFNDSLPIKIFEYMAAGIPVIASDFPLWRNIIEKHQCGFCVDPFNIQLINQKIYYLKLNPHIAFEMGERGRQAVIQHYNWQTQAQKLLHLYYKILK